MGKALQIFELINYLVKSIQLIETGCAPGRSGAYEHSVLLTELTDKSERKLGRNGRKHNFFFLQILSFSSDQRAHPRQIR